jgi:tetratricopeptide (TPR) repeat protein
MAMTDSVDVYGFPLRADLAEVWQQAMEQARVGAATIAATSMQRILSVQPDFAPAMVQAAYLQLAGGHYRDALALALQAGRSTPASSELVLEIVKLLRKFEAVESIERIVHDHDWSICASAQVLVQLAAAIAPVGLYQQALVVLDHAERIDADTPGIASLRGTIHMVRGHTSQAADSFRQALARSRVELPHVRWLMSMSPRGDLVATADAIRRAQARVAPGSEGEAYLAFALHNVLHAAGRYEESWRALARGCGIKRRLEPYDRARQHELFRLLHALEPAIDANSREAGTGSPGLIFIVGMHRSGTTLLERILAGNPDVADGGESYVFSACLKQAADRPSTGVLDAELVRRLAQADLADAGDAFRRYARWRAGGRSWMTEKLPSNFLSLGFILRALPEARILHMRRDPVDTCFSNLRTFFAGAATYSYDQHDLADYFLHYQSLMDHWHQSAPGRILDVDYAALVDDPDRQARAIAEFCGLQFEPGMLEIERTGGAVATASVIAARSGIRKDRGGAWKPYAAHLGPLLQALRHGGS